MILAHRSCAWLPLMVFLAFILPEVAHGQGIERPRVPLRTALDELRDLRESYSDAFNKHDMATRMAMYAPDAIVIRDDGTVLTGKDAIQTGFEAGPDSGAASTMSVTSDTVRVFGNTAYSVGTVKMSHPQGKQDVSHYLAVFRRGVKAWKISSLAVVPETSQAGARDSAGH